MRKKTAYIDNFLHCIEEAIAYKKRVRKIVAAMKRKVQTPNQEVAIFTRIGRARARTYCTA
ncbi:hypothetical protein PGIN_84-3_01987 [Porphyromonas gingivalis]|nr:hypothetical protein [Porphyromonas gingivalis]SJL26200.1 hypothetical protein PGIN_7BTORR_01895 [Porphyromonas gingivalis]SJL30841.1 hypothetical protein PGIN_AFR-5B1_00989 [Porphyromonas gingivalis]SJL33238.1 hypothetical protein PGIN_84-3_01987 [Porphyromonas gingivalis]